MTVCQIIAFNSEITADVTRPTAAAPKLTAAVLRSTAAASECSVAVASGLTAAALTRTTIAPLGFSNYIFASGGILGRLVVVSDMPRSKACMDIMRIPDHVWKKDRGRIDCMGKGRPWISIRRTRVEVCIDSGSSGALTMSISSLVMSILQVLEGSS